MFEKFAQELAFYEYMRSDCIRISKMQVDRNAVMDCLKHADYWDAKYHGLARGIEIATGYYPCAICHGESVEIHIGEYQAVKFFG